MELFSLLGNIAIDNSNANNEIDKTTKKAKDSEKETSGAFEKIGKAASTVGKGISLVGGAIGGAFIGAVEGTREYRTQMGLLESAFITAGHSTEVATTTFESLNAVLGDSGQATEAAQHLALITDNEKELQTWTDICTGVYATFGESLPIEGLTESANETAKVGAVTGSLADALNWAGISEDEFNEKLEKCSNEQERQDLIMETLNGTYKDASEQYKETNKDVMAAEQANNDLTNAMAEIGAIGEPIMTRIKEKIAEMAEKAIPLLKDMIEKFKDIVTWVKENEETIKLWVGVIIGATTTVGLFLLIINWGSIMAAATKAIQGVRLAVIAFNTVLKANPIGLVVSLIAGLVAAFIYLWNNCDSFREFWINLWEIISSKAKEALAFIKELFGNIGTWFKEKFKEVQESGKEAMDDLKKWFKDAWNDIKDAWSNTVQWFKDIWSGIKEAFSNVKEWIGGVFEGAWNLVMNVWNFYKAYYTGVWNGIKKIFSVVATWFKNVFNNAWNNIKKIWNNTKSYFLGIWNGITKIFSVVATWFKNVFLNAWNNIKKTWNSVKSFFQGIWNGIKNVFSSVSTWFKNVFTNAWNNIKKVFSGWGSFFSGLWTSIKNKFSSIGSSLGNALSSAVKSGLNKVLSSIESTINKAIGLINSAIKLANKLPGINVGTVKKISLPRLEKGGILKQGQIGFLEGSGDEAVIPLEKNTGWINKVADQLKESVNSNDNTVISLQLNKIVELLSELLNIDMNVYMDSDTLVGAISSKVDRQIGNIATRRLRGNT